MPPDKRQIKKTEDSTVRHVPYSKRRKRLLNKVGAMAMSETNKVDHFADPSVDDIIESRNTYPETIEAYGKQPLLDGKEEFNQLTKTHVEEEPIISPLGGNENEKLSMEELNLLEERTQYTLSLVKAKRREWENYQKVRGELEQTAEKISDEFQHIMGFQSTDQAQNATDELRTSPDTVSCAPANQKEGL